MTPWIVAYKAPLSMEFSRQEYWNGFAISFSRASSQARDQTRVSHIAGRCFIVQAASLVALLVKNLPAMQETWVRSLCWEDPLEYSGLENSTGSPRVAKSQARLSDFHYFTSSEF